MGGGTRDGAGSIRLIQGARITVRSLDRGRAMLALSGELDLDNSSALEAILAAHIDAGRYDLVLDASDVTFVDSTILAVLLRLHHRCENGGGRLTLNGALGGVARVIKTTGLDQIMRAEPQLGSETSDPRA